MIGVTQLIEELKNPVDWDKIAKSKSKKLGITTEELLEQWDKKRQNGIDIHERLLKKELVNDNVSYTGFDGSGGVAVYNKDSYTFKNNSVYLEQPIMLPCGITGYIDKLEIKRNKIYITDIKVKDDIFYSSSFKADNGFKVEAKKMLEPLGHLDDCSGNDVTLQLSLYMYMVWFNNKKLKPGKLYLRHVKSNDGGKITKDELVELPYLREEVATIVKYYKLNEN